MVKSSPHFQFEQDLAARGFTRIAGMDEVGRGPWAGPVVAAAVWLNPDQIPEGLNDSKQVTAKRRHALAEQLHALADVGIGVATVEEIEQFNILRASHIAMVRAVAQLHERPDFLLVDGNRVPDGLNCQCQPVVKGDTLSLSIAAASIVAKTWRDRHMVDLAQQHPGYGWETNAGYGTKMHQAGLARLGVTPHHRRSFKPIHNILCPPKNLSD